MAQVTASVTIGFGSSTSTGDTIFSAEIDPRDPGPNAGKTNFAPGDSVYLLLYAGKAVTDIAAFCTSGSISSVGGPVSITKTEDISFTNATEATTQYPITGSYSITWYGRVPVGMTFAGGNTFTTPEKAIATGSITYVTTGLPYCLSGVPKEYPTALAVFTGEDHT